MLREALVEAFRNENPFKLLPDDELDARMTLPIDLDPPEKSRISSSTPYEAHIGTSDVSWLMSEATNWPLIPYWVDINNLSKSIKAEYRHLESSAIVSFVKSISGDLRRTVVAAHSKFISVSDFDTNPVDENSSAEDAIALKTLVRKFGIAKHSIEFGRNKRISRQLFLCALNRHHIGLSTMLDRLSKDSHAVATIAAGKGARAANDNCFRHIISVESVGDLHENGSVLLVKSPEHSIVYKPRAMKLENKLGDLFSWFNDIADIPTPKIPKTIARRSYGWQEFVSTDSADSIDHVKYFQSLGATLAIGYLLNASDLHHENILCHRSIATIIDPECFFGASVTIDPTNGQDRLVGSKSQTVLSVGILPEYVQRANMEPFDISPIGHRRAGNAIYHQLVLKTANGLPALARIPHPENDRDSKDFKPHTTELVRSLKATLSAALDNRAELMELLDSFATCRVRHLIKPTWMYASTLQQFGTREDTALGADSRTIARESVLNQLWPGLRLLGEPALALFEHERREVSRGVIPTFERTAGSRGLYPGGDSNSPILALPLSGLDLAKRRISHLSMEDIVTQARLSKLALDIAFPPETATPTYRAGRCNDAAGKKKDALSLVIDDLYCNRISFQSSSWWPTTHDLGGRKFSLRLAPHGLYQGPAGILLLSGYAHVLYPSSKTANILHHSQTTLVSDTERMIASSSAVQLARSRNIGVFDGIWGAIYAAHNIATITGDRDLKMWAKNIAQYTSEGISEVKNYDIISGLSGILCVSAQMAQTDPEGVYERISQICTSRLGNLLEKSIGERSFTTGFAHGLSGALAAFKYAAQLESLIQEAKPAADFLAELIQTTYSPDKEDWRFNEPEEKEVRFPGWCRGAAGIAVAYRLHAELGEPGSLSTATTAESLALRVARHARPTQLCHGKLGNALAAFDHSGDRESGGRSSEALQQLIDSAASIRTRTGTWATGQPDGAGSGLMEGISGIGFAALALLAADQNIHIPNVLRLEVAI